MSKASGSKGRSEIFQADISDSKNREKLFDEVIDYFGDCHGLVNNAGVAPRERKDLLEMGEESFDRLININLKGSFFLSQTAARYWLSLPRRQRGFRCLVFVGSVSSEMVSVNRGEYCIAKSGLSAASQLYAYRLASDDIGVYELRPGIIQTDMTGAVKEKYDTLIAEGLVPQRRWGQPEDLGKAVSSLMKGDFAFSTGSVFHVDGALHISSL